MQTKGQENEKYLVGVLQLTLICAKKQEEKKVINVPWWDRSRPSSTHYVYKVIGEDFFFFMFHDTKRRIVTAETFSLFFFLNYEKWKVIWSDVYDSDLANYLSQVFPYVLHYLFNVFVWWWYFFVRNIFFITTGICKFRMISNCQSNLNKEIRFRNDFSVFFLFLKFMDLRC